jgi:hypothetical protein
MIKRHIMAGTVHVLWAAVARQASTMRRRAGVGNRAPWRPAARLPPATNPTDCKSSPVRQIGCLRSAGPSSPSLSRCPAYTKE